MRRVIKTLHPFAAVPGQPRTWTHVTPPVKRFVLKSRLLVDQMFLDHYHKGKQAAEVKKKKSGTCSYPQGRRVERHVDAERNSRRTHLAENDDADDSTLSLSHSNDVTPVPYAQLSPSVILKMASSLTRRLFFILERIQRSSQVLKH